MEGKRAAQKTFNCLTQLFASGRFPPHRTPVEVLYQLSFDLNVIQTTKPTSTDVVGLIDQGLPERFGGTAVTNHYHYGPVLLLLEEYAHSGNVFAFLQALNDSF